MTLWPFTILLIVAEWALFEWFIYIIPLRHKMIPLASKLLDLESKQNSDVELEFNILVI